MSNVIFIHNIYICTYVYMYVCVYSRVICTTIIVISVSSFVYQEDESSERFKRKYVQADFAQRSAGKAHEQKK